ncbi:MAG: response regulator transcription factor [Caldilineaceae bacterium]
MTKIRVVLADDHPVVRTGIRALLERAPDITIVAEAENGAEVLPLIEKHQPDVLVLDIEMPQLSGLEVTQRIKELQLPVRVLALSAYADDHYIHRLLSNGAAGYLVKEEAPHMIVEAVRGVASGQEGWMSRRAVAQMSLRARSDEVGSDLTPREKQVLALVVEGKTNQEIALGLKISESTVEKHVGALLSKLGVASRVEAAVQAVRKNLV